MILTPAEFVARVVTTVCEAVLLEAPRAAAPKPISPKVPAPKAATAPRDGSPRAIAHKVGTAPKAAKAYVSGERKDKLGRRRCYNQGKLIKCPVRTEPGKAKKSGAPADVSTAHKKAWDSYNRLQGKKQALDVAQKAYDARDRVGAASASLKLHLAQTAHDRAAKSYNKVRAAAAAKIDAFNARSKARPKASAPAPVRLGQQAAALHAAATASLEGNTGLSAQQRKVYSESVKKVFSRMSPKALERVQQYTKGYNFYANSKALGEHVAKRTPNIREALNRGAVIGGVYQHDRKTGGFMHLDGNFANKGTNADFVAKGMDLPHHTYAHEFTHAVDGPTHEISNSKEWQDAFTSEITGGQVSKYATTKASEGLAEFGRLVYSGDYDLGKIEKKFPKAAAVWKSHGIWPQS